MKLYRYTSHGEGVFSIGKRLLPKELINEAWEARKWLLKPKLAEGEYRFYLTQKGKDKYESTLWNVHKKYLNNIQCQEIEENNLKDIVYQDEWQIVIK